MPCWAPGASASWSRRSSTIRCCHAVPEAELIPVDHDGVVVLDALDRLLAADPRPALVSVMLANNETGVVQPVAAIAAIARKPRRALPLRRGAGAPARSRSIASRIGADLVTLSAHKLGGPPGIGALVVTARLELTPLLRGGGQERGRRAGTENLAGIAGFAAAAVAAAEEIAVYDRVRALRDALEAGVAKVAPEAVVLGAAAPRLPNTAAIAMPGVAAETQVIALDLDGVMVSAGAACSSGKVGPSHVLEAMGVGPDLVGSTIRVSLGWGLVRGRCRPLPRAWTGALSALPRFFRRSTRRMSALVADPARRSEAYLGNTMPIYLDNQSSTRLDPRVLEAMLPYFTEQFGNPHSASHAYGRIAAEAIERARGEIAALIHADPRETRIHLGRDRGEQPGDQGRGAFRPALSAERTSP